MHSFLRALPLVLPAVLAVPTINRVQTTNTINGQWIARLDDSSLLATVLSTVLESAGIESQANYSIGRVKAFSFSGDDAVLDILETLGGISHVEPDTKVWATVPFGYGYSADSVAPFANGSVISQNSSDWGLARISSREPGTNSYSYDSSAGADTYVYVIDTGIYTDHSDFGGRATHGATFVSGEGDDDGVGHGTHCAGTIGGTKWGVSKKTNIIAVKVLGSDGSGSNSNVLKGIDWAVSNAKQQGHIDHAVLSMSLGGPFSQTTNDAVDEAISEGVFISVAAGNDGEDASNASPASAPSVCTVGATNKADSRSDFSNYGKLVDIFAPGEDIQSAWIGGTTATKTISGTSMACPHIAGLAAYLITLEGPKAPQDLCKRIQELATKDVIQDPGSGSPNLLAHNGIN